VRVGLLNNLRAGRSNKQVHRILAMLRSHPDVLHVETESAREVPEALCELLDQEVDLLAVNGGDGTLQFALTELLSNPDYRGRLPALAPMRGGRTNMTALDLGARRDPAAGLQALLQATAAGRLADHVVPRPVLRVASSRRSDVQYGMFFGVGMIRRAIELVHRVFPAGRSQGVFGASLVTTGLIAKTLFRPTEGILTPDKLHVLLDGKPVADSEFYLGIATSLDRLFMRMNPYWGSGPGGVRFTAIASTAENLRSACVGILRGRPRPFVTPAAGYTSENVGTAELALSCGYTVDGELFEPEPDEHVTLSVDRRITLVRA
jgi:diacylglycerol kinase (ATP)